MLFPFKVRSTFQELGTFFDWLRQCYHSVKCIHRVEPKNSTVNLAAEVIQMREMSFLWAAITNSEKYMLQKIKKCVYIHTYTSRMKCIQRVGLLMKYSSWVTWVCFDPRKISWKLTDLFYHDSWSCQGPWFMLYIIAVSSFWSSSQKWNLLVEFTPHLWWRSKYCISFLWRG